MSEIRRVKLQLNLNDMESIVKNLGYRLEKNTSFNYYGSRKVDAELVIHLQGYSVGFNINKTTNETEMLVDSMYETKANKELIIPYKQRLIERKLMQSNWRITKKIDTTRELILEIG